MSEEITPKTLSPLPTSDESDDLLDFPDFPDLSPKVEDSRDKILGELSQLREGRTLARLQAELRSAQEGLGRAKEQADKIVTQREIDQILNRHHALRGFLMEQPEVIEFIRHDLVWLRVIMLLYGGLRDTQFATYAIQYNEFARALQLPEIERGPALNQARGKSPYWREQWDGDDVVYNIAVYLDTECGQGKRAAAAADLAFEPSSICFDCSLSSFLVAQLRVRLPGEKLIQKLRERRDESPDALMQACIYLALLGAAPLEAEMMLRDINQGSMSPAVVQHLRTLIEQRLSLFGDGVVLYITGKRWEDELAHLKKVLPAGQLEEVASQFYRSFCALLTQPPDVAALTPHMSNSYLNAELWASWLAGYGDDPANYFQETLNAMGQEMHSEDAVVNLHRAHVGRFLPPEARHLSPIPPVWERQADMYGEVLTYVQETHTPLLDGLFHYGLILFSGVSWEENEDLKTDALAATLLLPRKAYEKVMPALDMKLAERPWHEVSEDVVRKARQIEDPVIQARTLWRLWLAGLVSFDEVIAATSSIKTPLQSAVGFERLLKLPNSERWPALLQRHLEAVREIEDDDNNRVRALCRHALLLPDQERISIVQEALGGLGEIADCAQRSETLILVKQVFADQPGVLERLDSIAADEGDMGYRLKMAGCPSFLLAGLHARFARPVESTPVLLRAVLADTLALIEQKPSSHQNWGLLARAETRDVAMDGLLAEIAASDEGILPFSRHAADALSSLANQGRVDYAMLLLPHLGQAQPTLVDPWARSPPHPSYLPYAQLMAAECGRLDASNLPGVLYLLRHGKDIARYRAAIVVHSRSVFIGKPDPHHHASELGLEALLSISAFSLEMETQRCQGPANAAAWFRHNVLHDSPEVLRGLVTCIEESAPRREAACRILRCLYLLTGNALDTFVELLVTHRTGPAAESLLHAACALSDDTLDTPWPLSQQSALDDYWDSLPSDVAESVRGLSDRIAAVESVVCNAADLPSMSIHQLDERLSEHFVTPANAPPAVLSKCATYRLHDDPKKALSAGEAIGAQPAALRHLFAWVQASLAKSINDESPFLQKQSTLLEVAAACAPRSPAMVFNLIEDLGLENSLVEAAIRQPRFNGRAGAVTLLGFVRNPSVSFLKALRSAMADVAEVQQAAFKMVRGMRYVNPALALELIAFLREEDVTMAYAASRLLSVVGRHEKTTASDRDRIIRALAEAIKDPCSRQTVSAFECSGASHWITKFGTLGQRHYQSLMEIVNLT